jgi:hypothetical protein
MHSMTVNQAFEFDEGYLSNQLEPSQFLYSSERYIRDSNRHVETWQTKVFITLISVVIIALLIVLLPIILLFWLYAIYQTKKLRKKLEAEKEQILKKIKQYSSKTLRELEAKIAPYLDFLNEIIDIGSDSDNYITSRSIRGDSIYVVKTLNELMKEVRKAQAVDLIQKGLTQKEIDDYNLRIAPLRDLWEDENSDPNSDEIKNISS